MPPLVATMLNPSRLSPGSRSVSSVAAAATTASPKSGTVAISLGAVFFGAFTYIGNGPNFMVKSIAEQVGIKMPSFFSYIVKYSIPVLLPVLIVIWLIFFMGH